MPAGEYVVVPLKPSLVTIRSRDGHQSVLAQTNTLEVTQASADGKFIFNRYGDIYFLSQIWTPGEEVGRMLPMSKVEKEVAGGFPASETTILIAGSVKK